MAKTLPFRPCVGVTLFNKQGLVWVGKRKWNGQPEHENTALWQMPQGGIDKGEMPQDAAPRELAEETNVTSISLLAEAPDWYSYELPSDMIGKALKGKYRGQTQRWYAYRFEGDDSEINVHTPMNGAHPAEFSEWKWVELETVPELIVPFKRSVYDNVVKAFKSFSQPI